MIPREKGAFAEMIVIGELAKFEIHVAQPLSDIFPYDLIIIYENKLLKAQVKSASPKGEYFQVKLGKPNSKGRYSSDEVDVFIVSDFEKIYLFRFDELDGNWSVTLRYNLKPNCGGNKQRFADDYILSKKRIKEVFGNK